MISASIMCADLLNLRQSALDLQEAGVDLLHCDVMDGHFVPNWMLFPDLLNALRAETKLPLDVHLMISDPMAMLPRLDLRENDIITISLESTPHAQRALAMVKDKGLRPGLALNPGTPLNLIEELLPDIGMLLLMTVNPGFAGQKMVPQSLGKIARARKMLDNSGYAHIPIEVDGNCSFENIPLMVDAGADIIVTGTSSMFKKGLSLKEGARLTREAMRGSGKAKP